MYGTVRDLYLLRKKFNVPIFVCLEPKSNVDRYKINSDYKSTRKRVAGIYDLWEDTLKAISLMCGIHIISSHDSGEADDVLFSLVHEFNRLNLVQKFLVYSTDNDLLQIDIPDVYYISLKKQGIVSFDDYCNEKYSLPPKDILMYRSIVGDMSDNISSVKPRFSRKFARDVSVKYDRPVDYPLDLNIPNKYNVILNENREKWQANYDLMELKKLELINVQPEYKPIDYFIEKYGMQSFKRMLGQGLCLQK